MANPPGNNGGTGCIYLLDEAECDDGSSDEDEEEEEVGEDCVDDAACYQGNTIALFVAQEASTDEAIIQSLKRKYVKTPQQDRIREIEEEISPRLEGIHLETHSQKVKRKLFQANNAAKGELDVPLEKKVATAGNLVEVVAEVHCPPAGHDETVCSQKSMEGVEEQDELGTCDTGQEAESALQNTEPEIECLSLEITEPPVIPERPWLDGCTTEQEIAAAHAKAKKIAALKLQEKAKLPIQLLKTGNRKAQILSHCKKTFGISFIDITRPFKNDNTVNETWVILSLYLEEEVADALLTVLEPHCKCCFIISKYFGILKSVLILIEFQTAKSRKTVLKLMSSVMAVDPEAIIADPPRVRSMPAALYWYKVIAFEKAAQFGEIPGWILTQVTLQHSEESELPFDLSVMVQWAYDNDYDTDYDIAFEYAKLATADRNARAFLNSNCQAKYVKDCQTMVRLYRKAQMHRMSMGAWIKERSDKIDGDGDWRIIVHFLRYQEVEFVSFMVKFKLFLKGTPKKNCLLFYGPPNTGKSAFCMSLIKFFAGRVVSFMNARSHFWLQPLADCRVGLLDDATDACWDYVDTYMRSAFDGNEISLDCKHKAPIQLKCPPLLVTSNTNILTSDRWKYLHSRVTVVKFMNPFPLTQDGQPRYNFQPKDWKSFLSRLWARLDLSEPEEDEEDEGYNGDSQEKFRCTIRENDEHL
ncbi:E1 [Myotis ricketti papillomavirus 1]|uniref:Replication protein E1 n=1 Tax=Myotis ricketti papillomavirus 1 TaxID=1195370 RepID=I3VR46_9PAPI|nr:E1 [Myotis ricketti papillomavirus 1]AFK84991.1 E1 [Myotis ricketti papillomavirus 1]